MDLESVLGVIAIVAVVGFIGWRVWEAKNKEPNNSSDVGGGGRPGDKGGNQQLK